MAVDGEIVGVIGLVCELELKPELGDDVVLLLADEAVIVEDEEVEALADAEAPVPVPVMMICKLTAPIPA